MRRVLAIVHTREDQLSLAGYTIPMTGETALTWTVKVRICVHLSYLVEASSCVSPAQRRATLSFFLLLLPPSVLHSFSLSL